MRLFWVSAALLMTIGGVFSRSSTKYLYLDEESSSAATVIEYTTEQEATTTTNDSSSSFRQSNHPRVVEFYSPYCGHCHNFKPKYLSLAKQVKDLHPEIEFHAVSCVAHSDVCKEFKVGSYPSLYTFQQGSVEGKRLDRFSLKKIDVAMIEQAFDQGKNSPIGATTSRRALDEDKDDDDKKDDDDNAQVDKVEDEIDEEEAAAKEDEEDDDFVAEPGSEKKEEKKLDYTTDKALLEIDETAVVEDAKKDYEKEQTNGEDDDDNASADGDNKDDDKAESEQDEDRLPKASRHDRPETETAGESPEISIERLESMQRNQYKGARAARDRARDMDKWREEMARRKERIDGRHKGLLRVGRRGGRKINEAITEDATTTMRANKPGTQEYEDRKNDIIKAIRKAKGRKRARQVEEKLRNQGGSALKPAYKKALPKPKAVEKIPVLKRLTKMSHEEELLLDAYLSFFQSLRFGVFKDKRTLNANDKKALKNWLTLLRTSLPQEWSLHDLIDDLIDQIDYVAGSENSLEDVLGKYPLPRVKWSKSCHRGGKSTIAAFNCGFWKLLHVMTVGVAEYRGGLNLADEGLKPRNAGIFSPEQAADIFREYMANFFPCQSCQEHFLADYDGCSFRRCDRLTDKTEDALDADWKEFAKWLWEFHNGVSVRILNEKADKKRLQSQRSSRVGPGPGAASMNDEIQALWPTIHDCITCFNTDGTWNEDAVFIYLEQTYWPTINAIPKAARLLQFEDSVAREFHLTAFLVVVGIVMLFVMSKNLFGKNGLRQTMLVARTLGPRGAAGAQKRSV